MKQHRLLRSALVLAAALGFASGSASAQQYPAQDLHFICAFPPGSGADVLVRYFAEKVRPLTGKNIIVENRAGAGGNIALTYSARAKPDGYTVFVHGVSGVAASMSLFKNPAVDVAKEIQVAGTINQQPYMIAVHASKPYKTLADLTAALKAKGDKGTYGTANPSSTITAEIYKNTMKLDTVRVEYKTGQDMVNELQGGTLDFASADPVQALSMQAKGEWRILGISTGKRLNSTGDLPTMTEQGVPMDVTGWWGAMVPMATPKPVVDQIQKWFAQVVSADDTKQFLAKFGGDALVLTPAEAQAKMLKDITDWNASVKLAKIEPQG